jgi:hypothetical protein
MPAVFFGAARRPPPASGVTQWGAAEPVEPELAARLVRLGLAGAQGGVAVETPADTPKAICAYPAPVMLVANRAAAGSGSLPPFDERELNRRGTPWWPASCGSRTACRAGWGSDRVSARCGYSKGLSDWGLAAAHRQELARSPEPCA